MPSHYPLRNPRSDRNDTLPNIVTGDELCNDIWENNRDIPRGPIGIDLEDHLDERHHHRIDTLTLLIEKVAESQKYGEYKLNGTTYPLIIGHTPLMNAVSVKTREVAGDLQLIERAQFYGNDKQVAPRNQIGRTSFWALGPAAKHYVDMQSIRGFDDDSPHPRGDRNEGMAHRVLAEFEKTRINAQPGLVAESYVRLPKHVPDEYSNNVYDVVAFDPSDNSVVETVEVEIQTNDAKHIAEDAAKLANAPGKSTWCVPNKASQNQFLRSMAREGVLTPGEDDPGFPHALATNLANDRVESLLVEGKYRRLGQELPITEIRTANGTRSEIQKAVPDVLSVQAIEMRGDDR